MSTVIHDILGVSSAVVCMDVDDVENTLWFSCILFLRVEGKENPGIYLKVTGDERRLLKILIKYRDDIVHRYTKKRGKGALKVLISELCEEFDNYEMYYTDSSVHLLQSVYGVNSMYHKSFMSISHKACMYVKYDYLGYLWNYITDDIIKLKSLLSMILLSETIREQNQQIVGRTDSPYTVKCYDYNTEKYFTMTLSQEWISKIKKDIKEVLE